MRRALWLLLLVPLAAGHGDEDHSCDLFGTMGHLEIWNETVAPGGKTSVQTAFNGCPLPEGWWVNYWMDGAGLELSVNYEGATYGPWAMQGERFLRTPGEGFPVLTVHNPTNESRSFELYFDHTCDCTGKVAPRDGGIWFNTPTDGAVDWSFRFAAVAAHADVITPSPETFTVHVAMVEPTIVGPQTLREVTRTFTMDDDCMPESSRLVGCMDVMFEGDIDGTQYLWMRVEHDAGPEHLITVAPTFEQVESPGWPVLGFVALLGLAAMRRYN